MVCTQIAFLDLQYFILHSNPYAALARKEYICGQTKSLSEHPIGTPNLWNHVTVKLPPLLPPTSPPNISPPFSSWIIGRKKFFFTPRSSAYIRGLQKFIRIFADDFADRNFKLYIIKIFLGAFDQQNYQQLLQQKKSC